METTTDLVLPRAGSRTLRDLLSSALRQAMSVSLSLGAQPGATPLTSAFQRDIAPTLRAQPGILAASLRMPSRLVLARCLALDGAGDQRSRWSDELAMLLALDTARAGALGAPVTLDGAPLRLVDERAGVAFHTLAPTRWTLDSTGATLASAQGETRIAWTTPFDETARALSVLGATLTRSHAPLFDDVTLTLEDNNPLADVEAHPDKQGNRIDLGGRSVDEWSRALSSAFAVIEDVLPEIAGEMRLLLRQVGPVGWYADLHLSASYVEATGVVYLSLHPNELTLVEALVHEFQHNKLNLLLAEDRVLENADHPLFASPVRPDARPLRGVLLAVHAFQPLVVLYDRLVRRGSARAASLSARRGELARICREGCDVLLPNAVPTPRGAPLLREIAALDHALAEHLGEPSDGA